MNPTDTTNALRAREDLRFLIAYTIPHPIREFVISNLVDRGWLTDGGDRSNVATLTSQGQALVEAALATAQPEAKPEGEDAVAFLDRIAYELESRTDLRDYGMAKALAASLSGHAIILRKATRQAQGGGEEGR